jgi:hypothetical protein
LGLAVADAVKSDTAANDKAAPVPATVSACESLRAKQPDGAVVVCDLKGEPSAAARVTLKRGAASSIAVTLHKAESGAWAGYGVAEKEPSELKGVFVGVDASGLVVCVWDAAVPETAKYKATLVDAASSPYKVYMLTPSRLDTSIVVLSGPSPFPSPVPSPSCETLARKVKEKENEKDTVPKVITVPVSCGTSGDPAVVRVTRGAAVYERVALYKQESGSWAGYGADGAVSGVYVLVAPTGHEVTCVWDGSVTTTVAYSAIPSASERSTYALVPTVFDAGQDPVKDPVKLALVSGRNPFPSPSETAGSESTLSPGAIAGIAAAAFVALLLLLVAATALAVRSGKKRRYRGLWS